MNNTIASGIIDAVIKLTNHATDLVRKKAILILQKIVMFINKYRKPKQIFKSQTIKSDSRKLCAISNQA